jgi:drug/metabolite transporter (DMT)-like permease
VVDVADPDHGARRQGYTEDGSPAPPTGIIARFRPASIVSARGSTLLPVLGLFVVAVALGAGHVCARLAFTNGVNVLTAATLRSLCAAFLLLALLRLRRTPVLPLPREFRATLILGLLIAAQTVLIQAAVALMPATLAILFFYTYPFFAGLGAALLGDERFSGRLAAALAAAFAGLALVLGVGAEPVSLAGLAAAIGAALSFAAAVVLTPRLAPRLAAPLRTFYMLAATAALFVAVLSTTLDVRLPHNAPGWIGLAGLALLYAAGITGLFLLLPLLGPVRSSVVLNLEPVAVAVIAWIALGEALAPTQIAGGVLVVAAVIFAQTAPRTGGVRSGTPAGADATRAPEHPGAR